MLQQPRYFLWTVTIADKEIQAYFDLLFLPVQSTTAKFIHEERRPRADYKVMQADQTLLFSPVEPIAGKRFFPWTAKVQNRLQGHAGGSRSSPFTVHSTARFFQWTVTAQNRLQDHAGWWRPSLFTSRLYNCLVSFHEQLRPRTDYKDMQADQDLHYSPVDSTTTKFLSMNRKGLGQTTRACRLIKTFTFHQ